MLDSPRRRPAPLHISRYLLLAAVLVSCDPERAPDPSAAPVEPAPPDHVEGAEGAEGAPVAAPETAARPMMIVFSRDYCTPCRVMKPWVAELAREEAGVDIVSVNVDRQEYEHLGRFFQVSAVPTIAFIGGDGRVMARREELASKKEMRATLRRLGWRD